jgi:hypothetical protein
MLISEHFSNIVAVKRLASLIHTFIEIIMLPKLNINHNSLTAMIYFSMFVGLVLAFAAYLKPAVKTDFQFACYMFASLAKS